MTGTLKYVRGDATDPQRANDVESVIIAHVVNDLNLWGAGFVLALSKRWKEPERRYRSWFPQLGHVQFVPVEHNTVVANMVGQRGVRSHTNSSPVDYDAIESCLTRVAGVAKVLGASVHMPRIGCGLAGGRWDKVEPIIQRALCDHGVDVVVYDL